MRPAQTTLQIAPQRPSRATCTTVTCANHVKRRLACASGWYEGDRHVIVPHTLISANLHQSNNESVLLPSITAGTNRTGGNSAMTVIAADGNFARGLHTDLHSAAVDLQHRDFNPHSNSNLLTQLAAQDQHDTLHGDFPKDRISRRAGETVPRHAGHGRSLAGTPISTFFASDTTSLHPTLSANAKPGDTTHRAFSTSRHQPQSILNIHSLCSEVYTRSECCQSDF